MRRGGYAVRGEFHRWLSRAGVDDLVAGDCRQEEEREDDEDDEMREDEETTPGWGPS